jgi:2-dehydropantoate 2-reductase
MSQDVMNCRLTEIDAINGAIVEQAKLYNVKVHYNSLIVDLIHAIEGAYQYHKDGK